MTDEQARKLGTDLGNFFKVTTTVTITILVIIILFRLAF